MDSRWKVVARGVRKFSCVCLSQGRYHANLEKSGMTSQTSWSFETYLPRLRLFCRFQDIQETNQHRRRNFTSLECCSQTFQYCLILSVENLLSLYVQNGKQCNRINGELCKRVIVLKDEEKSGLWMLVSAFENETVRRSQLLFADMNSNQSG
jgi:hypothetical protein